MSEVRIVNYSPEYFDRWNNFVESSNNGTLFHRLDFLAYHGERFITNQDHLLWMKGDKIIALLPLGIFNENHRIIARSPFGASYGGLVYNENCSFSDMEAIYLSLVDYLKSRNVKEFFIILVPSIYYKKVTNYFDFFVIKNGGEFINSDLTAYIPVVTEPYDVFSYSAKKSTAKAFNSHVQVYQSEDIETFYRILLENRKKFNTLPVHSLADVGYLIYHFPEKIKIFLAKVDNLNIAGTLLFKCNESVLLDFYWAHLDDYQSYRPINAIVYEVTKWAFNEGFKYFDFGTQTVNMVPNYGGTNFKESFGSAGVFRHTLKLSL
jgi:hypothetical protein